MMSNTIPTLSRFTTKLNNEKLSEIMQTVLSPHVKSLITLVGLHDHPTSSTNFLLDGFINWKEIERILPVKSDEDEQTDTDEYFEQCIHSLGYVFKKCEEEIGKNESKGLTEKYREFLEWTGQEKVIEECFRLVKTGEFTDNYIAVLLLTSCLERALGDVYLLENAVCPSMLKDLLSSSYLRNVLGPTPIQVLRSVMGPPISLNLRNVIWHGFPTEIEISKRYSCFLLLTIPSLSQFMTSPIQHRTPVVFHQGPQYEEILPDLSGLSKDDVSALINSSHFIPPYQQRLWNYGIDLYFAGDHGKSIVLLIPLLEHGLRCLFTKGNNCPERMITAEATTLYTTLDEILSQYVEEGIENKLPQELGTSVMELLLDLFTYPNGPRVRDKISHGEADVFDIPSSLCSVVVVALIHLSSKYNKSDEHKDKIWLQKINTWIDSYESLFHPVSLLKSKIRQVVTLASQFSKQITIDYNMEERKTWKVEEIINPENNENTKVIKEISVIVNLICNQMYNGKEDIVLDRLFFPFVDGSPFIQEMLTVKIETIYKYTKESGCSNSEKVVLLLKIATECETILTQVYTALQNRQLQHRNKTLRSRQRQNLHSLINSCFMIHQAIHLVIFLTTVFLVTIETKQSNNKTHIKCLKTTLQFTENFRTYTNDKNNKWIECTNLLLKYLEKLKSVFQ